MGKPIFLNTRGELRDGVTGQLLTSKKEEIQTKQIINSMEHKELANSLGGEQNITTLTSILADGFGTAIGDQLAEELEKQNNVCCHHLVHYHEANKKAVGEDSARYLDLVHKWLRITGHMSRCLICGG